MNTLGSVFFGGLNLFSNPEVWHPGMNWKSFFLTMPDNFFDSARKDYDATTKKLQELILKKEPLKTILIQIQRCPLIHSESQVSLLKYALRFGSADLVKHVLKDPRITSILEYENSKEKAPKPLLFSMVLSEIHHSIDASEQFDIVQTLVMLGADIFARIRSTDQVSHTLLDVALFGRVIISGSLRNNSPSNGIRDNVNLPLIQYIVSMGVDASEIKAYLLPEPVKNAIRLGEGQNDQRIALVSKRLQSIFILPELSRIVIDYLTDPLKLIISRILKSR